MSRRSAAARKGAATRALQRAARERSALESLPAAAQADYREYLRQGGRFDVAVWWERYKDYYRKAES